MPETNTAIKQEPIPAGPTHSASLLPSLLLAASVILLGGRFFWFIWKYAVDILFWDQWVYLSSFFGHSPRVKELFFKQWGPHREGIGLIPDMILYPLTNWNTRAESFMIGGCIFLAMIVALIVKRKLFGRFDYSDLAIPLMFLNMAQWEVMTGTPNPAHSAFPLLLVLLYCLALLIRRKLLKYALLLLLNFFLIFTGFGIFMGIITLGVFAAEIYLHWRGQIEGSAALPLAGFLIAGASLGSFFIHYTFWPAVDCFVFPYHPVAGYAQFMAMMLWGFVGYPHWTVLGTVVGTMMLLVALAAFVAELRAFFRSDGLRNRHMVRLVLLGFSLLFIVNTAIGRVCLGRDAAMSSRYLTLLIPAFLAIYFCLLPLSRKPAARAMLGLFVVMLIPSALIVRPSARRDSNGKRAWAACYLQAENIAYCDDATNFKVDPYPDYNRLKEKLDYLKQHRLNLFSSAAK